MSEDFVVDGECYAVDMSATPPILRRWNGQTWNWVKARVTADTKRRLIARYEARLASCPAIDPKASQSVGHPVLTDPRPQNLQGQATGYRPKGTWK